MDDLNRLTSHDYRLIDVEAFFRAKGRRQLDFVTSQGCLFRCSFCADPAVFGRGWSGLDPERVLDELNVLHRRFGMTDLAFQDETLFTNLQRVRTIARGFLVAGKRFTWTATLRADQGRRMTDEDYELFRASGLRKVVLGVESGSATTLRRIRKDITLDDVRTTTARLLRHEIGADIGIIVGFPDEPEQSVLDSLEIAGELCDMSPLFKVSLFNYQPYPGSAIADGLTTQGGPIPSSLVEWAAFDYVDGRSGFLGPRLDRVVEHFRFYKRFAFARTRNPARWPLHALARWRVARHAYSLPFERRVIERWWPTTE